MTSRIAGMIATFNKVSVPATASAFETSVPASTAEVFALSNHLPITGNTSETENIPAPPINDNPNAPVLGRYSDTKPSIVGQKKQMPAAKTAAAPKAAYPLDLLKRNKPIPENNAENINMPLGFSRCTIGPANERPTAIMPFIKTRINIPETPAPLNKALIHVPVPNSVAAVINMQIIITIYNGFKQLMNISFVLIPFSTLSVLGKSSLQNMRP